MEANQGSKASGQWTGLSYTSERLLQRKLASKETVIARNACLRADEAILETMRMNLKIYEIASLVSQVRLLAMTVRRKL